MLVNGELLTDHTEPIGAAKVPDNQQQMTHEDTHSSRAPEIMATTRYAEGHMLLGDDFLLFWVVLGLAIFVPTTFGIANNQLHVEIYSPFAVCPPSSCLAQIFSDDTSSSEYNFATAFLFRSLPSEVFVLFGLLWLSADTFYRNTEPFAGMIKAMPATSNLLLDYPSSPPIVITLKALSNHHWRVAIFSVCSLLATSPPIVAAGIFVSTPTQTGYVITIQQFNFWFCYAVLVLYLITIPFARPTPAYRLPRSIRSLADVLIYCYASRILDDSVLGEPVFSAQDKADRRIHLESKIHLAKRKYQFGVYMDEDGQEHFGFDVAEREGLSGQESQVRSVDPGRAIYGGFGSKYYFRRPEFGKYYWKWTS